MYAKKLGWLHSTPKDKKQSRYDQYKDNPVIGSMPDADEKVVSSFHAIGVCSVGMAGAVAINWQEIDAYCNRSGDNLSDWECLQISMMSRLYCSAKSSGTNEDEPSPWNDNSDYAVAKNREIVSKRMMSLRKNKGNKQS